MSCPDRNMVPSPQGSYYVDGRSCTGSAPVPPTPLEHLYGNRPNTFVSPSPVPPSSPPVDLPPEGLLSQHAVDNAVEPPSYDVGSYCDSLSSVSVSQSPFDRRILAPPLNNYLDFLRWFVRHFSTYFSSTFQEFLLDACHLVSIGTFKDFFETMDMAALCCHLGPSTYDYWRPYLLDFSLVWWYLKIVFVREYSTLLYTEILSSIVTYNLLQLLSWFPQVML